MAGTKIRLKFPAYCAEETCGAYLPAGSLVRYYGRNGIYGIHCHTKLESIQGRNSRFMEEKLKERERREKAEIEEQIAAVYGDSQGPPPWKLNKGVK